MRIKNSTVFDRTRGEEKVPLFKGDLGGYGSPFITRGEEKVPLFKGDLGGYGSPFITRGEEKVPLFKGDLGGYGSPFIYDGTVLDCSLLIVHCSLIKSDRYWLKNASIPTCLLVDNSFPSQTREGLCWCDLEIVGGIITQILPAGSANTKNLHYIDLQRGIVFPCFTDIHTHLDKGHIWERSPNPDCTFSSAITAIEQDVSRWSREDVSGRMEFALKCSYAHGTKAIRTHIDCFQPQADISLDVFQTLQQEWQGKIALQAVSLVTLDYYQTPAGQEVADKIAAIGGILGGVACMDPELDAQLDTVFSLARERDLDLDFHADENGNPDSICLQRIALAALRHQFTGKIICGHCCSLAVQPPEIIRETLDLVKQAQITIVSLPSCNLYLQGRSREETPYWRGVTKVWELKQQGISVAFASDNCRDPFFGFGDHDMLDVFNQAVRIAHLDLPYGDWVASVTKTPAELMGLAETGIMAVGMPADLVLFKARYFSELLSRCQGDRLVLRHGQEIDTTLPDYRELDS